MNIFDFIIFLPIVFGFIFGLFKGFVHELVSFLAFFAALLAAAVFTPVVKPLLVHLLSVSEKTGSVFAYILVFAGTIIAMFLSSKFIEKLISKIHMKWANSFAGGILGALKFAIIISVLMNVFDAFDSRFHVAKQEKKDASIGYYPILKIAPSFWKESKNIYDMHKSNHNPDSENGETEK